MKYIDQINQFNPDYFVYPGEILEETLQARGIKKAELAKRCSLSEKTISHIISGKAPINPATAIQLERVLGVSASVWNNLESFYRLHEAKTKAREELKKKSSWAKSFPITKLIKRGIIEKPVDEADCVEKLLNFLGVGSVDAWEKEFQSMEVAFKKSASFTSAPESVTAWLRVGHMKADNVFTEKYNKNNFKKALKEIRSFTVKSPVDFENRMKELCRQSGVALLFVAELPKTHLSGATQWLSKDKALIILSLRHKSDDHFWFTFFHEAAHILLHGKKERFLDERKMEITADEKQANQFAANFLINEDEYKNFIETGKFTEHSVKSFAKKINIAPGIVVGRLQHDKKIKHSYLNNLKRKFDLSESNIST